MIYSRKEILDALRAYLATKKEHGESLQDVVRELGFSVSRTLEDISLEVGLDIVPRDHFLEGTIHVDEFEKRSEQLSLFGEVLGSFNLGEYWDFLQEIEGGRAGNLDETGRTLDTVEI